MKRLLLPLILILTLTLALCGCVKEKYGILSYQDENITAECIVNEKYSVTVKKLGENVTLTINEPLDIRGIVFEKQGEALFARSGEMTLPLEREEAQGIYALCDMFSLKEECLVRTHQSGTQPIFEFEETGVRFTVLLGRNNMPNKITIEGESISYTIEVVAISVGE